MPDEIHIDDVPEAELAILRHSVSGRPLSADVYATLQRFTELAPGFALRIRHVTRPAFRTEIWKACDARWPGTQVI